MQTLVGCPLGKWLSFFYGIEHEQKKLHKKRKTRKYGFRKIQASGIMGIALPSLSQLHILRYECATLIDASTTEFGQQCMRLANIVFHASQMFPSMMGSYLRITQYLQAELLKRHPSKHFHIIIGIINDFSCAISNGEYFAEMTQENYRILIFSTKSHNNNKVNTHGVNNQMKLKWNSVVIKRIKD